MYPYRKSLSYCINLNDIIGKNIYREFVMRSFLVYFFIVLFSIANANTNLVVGSVQLLKGSVKIKSENSFKKSKLSVGSELKSGDLITTSKKSTVVIKLVDNSTLVLEASSTLHFISSNLVEQKEGKIYYKITSRDAKNALKVKTPFAIIGIKGTTFIIKTAKNSSVLLKEGVIGIKSIKEEFELYRKEVQKQFDDFMTQQEKAFQEYKEAQRPGFAEITSEFELQSGKTISFEGKKVKEKSWSEADDAEFEMFEKLMDSIK